MTSPFPGLGTGTTLERDTELRSELGNGPTAHIVKRRSGKDEDSSDAVAQVMEARFNGTPIEALCGHVWVPSRDPKKLPLCQLCKDIFDLHGDFGDHDGKTDPTDLPS